MSIQHTYDQTRIIGHPVLFYAISDDVVQYIRSLEERLGLTDLPDLPPHKAAAAGKVPGADLRDLTDSPMTWSRPQAVSNAFKVNI